LICIKTGRRSASQDDCGARAAAGVAGAARAQTDRVPRIALFMGIADDAEGRRRAAAFRQALQQSGWKEVSNVRIDERWGVADTDVIRASAIELLQLNPSVIVVQGARAVPILQQATTTIPIVFVSISDPVGRGIVTNMARPGGNITEFQLFEFSVIGKLLEALREIAPKVTRVACRRPAGALRSACGEDGASEGEACQARQ
jgi:putative ABC transport system substrate-binding protein